MNASPAFFTMKIFAPLLSAFLILLVISSHARAQSPLSGFNPATLSDRPTGAFIDGRFFTSSEAVELRAIYLDKWDGNFHPETTNNSELVWMTDAGLAYGGWRLAGFYRGEAFMKANKDTLELLRMLNLKEINSPNAFDIDIGITGFSATGIELSKGFRLDAVLEGLDAGITARYLRGLQIQEGTLTGTAATTSPATYEFDLLLDYVYDKNIIYERTGLTRGKGNGLSFDLGFRYKYSPNLKAELVFRDIMGTIYWNRVPYTTANAASEVISFDENGFQQYRPTINGFEGYKDFRQNIQLKTDLSVSYTRGALTLRPEVNFIGERSLKWIFLGYLAGNTAISTGYNLEYGTISLGITHRIFSMQAFTSHFDPSDANALGLAFSINHEF